LHPLKNVLNKIFWDEREDPADYEITYVHRGAEGDKRTISATDVKDVGASWFSLRREDVVIPFHRILEIRNVRSNRTVWVSRKIKRSGPSPGP